MREHSLGIKIPPTNLEPDFGDQLGPVLTAVYDAGGHEAANAVKKSVAQIDGTSAEEQSRPRRAEAGMGG
jgi:hypothetical protein